MWIWGRNKLDLGDGLLSVFSRVRIIWMKKKVVEIIPIHFRVVSMDCVSSVSTIADTGGKRQFPHVAYRHSFSQVEKYNIRPKSREVVWFPVPLMTLMPSDIEVFKAFHHVSPIYFSGFILTCYRVFAL